MEKTTVLITDGLADEGKTIFRDAGYQLIEPGEIERIADANVLVVKSATKVTREVIEKANRLRIIGRAGIGVDNIDVRAAAERGIVVKNAPDGNVNAAAEITVGLMFAAARFIPQAYSTLAEKNLWQKKIFEGIEITGKTIGVIGYGKIGKRVAQLLKGFDVNVIAYDTIPNGNGVRYVGLDELLQTADFVTLHTPKTEHPLIGERELQIMKPTAILINASRGPNVDENAVYGALEAGIIAGAAFDVYKDEGKDGKPYANRLFGLPNFVGLPHLGASTIEAQKRTAAQIAEGIINYLEREDLTNVVRK